MILTDLCSHWGAFHRRTNSSWSTESRTRGALLGLISQIDDCEFGSERVPVVTSCVSGNPEGAPQPPVCTETLAISKDYTIKLRGTTSSAEATTSGRLAELQAFVELGLPSTAELRRRNQGFYTDGAGVAVPGGLRSEPPRGWPGSPRLETLLLGG